jgi:3-oxoacyl-[acyl-carrier-protein] synthase II
VTRVVVTGLGVVSAAGNSVPEFWRTLAEGRSATARIRRFDASGFPSQVAGEVDVERIESSLLIEDCASLGRIARFAAAAIDQAVTDTGPAAAAVRDRTGVLIGSGLAAVDHDELIGPVASASCSGRIDWRQLSAELLRRRRPEFLARTTPGALPARVAAHYGFGGPVMSVMTACAGGTQALGDALRWIRLGRADRVVVAGADSELSPMGLASFCLLGALSRRNHAPDAASRPFARTRDGFVLAEGAAAVILEERDHALARGARIYAELAGFGSASDAYRVTDPHPDGTGAVLAMTRALQDAGVGADRLDYINAHGTSTPANDRIETLAIKRVLGNRAAAVPVSATKSMIGHATVAAGAIEAVATVMTLVHQFVHPTINLHDADPDCDLDYVPNQGRRAAIETAMSNSFAFGGQSAAVVFRRHGSA